MRVEEDKYWHTAPRLPQFADLDDNNANDYSGGDDDDYRGKGGGRPHVLREVIETIVLTLLIFFVVRAVVQNFKVEGDSMLPTLHTEQYLLVNKGLYFRYDANFIERITNPSANTDMRYLFHGPQRGDIVVFEAWNEQRDFIKRIVAIEGETVEVIRDEDPGGDPSRDCGKCGVYVDGVKLNEPYVNQTPNYDLISTPNCGPREGDGTKCVVPPGHVFVLGDNRRNSSDSHVQGPLDVQRIVGVAFVTYWPQERWGLLPHPTYAEIERK